MQAVDARIAPATTKGRAILLTLCVVAFLDILNASSTPPAESR
ncbi:hypothetical protein [Dactylosporangium sp. NPDC049140]